MSDAVHDRPRLVLIETHHGLPGLLPGNAHDELRAATAVFAEDPTSVGMQAIAWGGVDVRPVPTPALERADMDLTRPGDAGQRRRAKGVLTAAVEASPVAYLLDGGDDPFARIVGIEAARVGVDVEFVFLVPPPLGAEVLTLATVLRRLRDPEDGCPWDLEQDHQSLRQYLVEETWELVDAIERGDDEDLVEELGDVLMQVVFHAQVATDRGAFGLDDVARGITDKLVRRHPHVFADATVDDADEVQQRWDELKAAEKAERTGPFDGVPMGMPALSLTQTLLRKAARTGFDWPDPSGPLARIHEELAEVAEATDGAARAEEFGDLLLAVVGYARTLGVDAEEALRAGARKFRSRVEGMLAGAEQAGVDTATLDPDSWTTLWDAVKDA